MPDLARTLVIFGMTRLEAMLAKGNVWYVSHYREAFDKVVCVYLVGADPPRVAREGTELVSAGATGFVMSLLGAPFRLFRVVHKSRGTHFLTADILTSWWTASLVRLIYKADIVVMPVCTPDEIYRNSGRSFSGLPKRLEDTLIWLSFACANRILVAENSPATRRWLARTRFHGKVVVAEATPEELPSADFLDQIEKPPKKPSDEPKKWILSYVGRLEPEKHVECLIDVAARLRDAGLAFEIGLIGTGTLEVEMRRQASSRNLDEHIKFRGFQDARSVADHLSQSDVFLSTLTGTALKEAALVRLPVIAFEIDYVPDLLTDGHNVLLVPVDDAIAMAEAVLRLTRDHSLRERLSRNLHDFATSRWTPAAVRSGLQTAFQGL